VCPLRILFVLEYFPPHVGGVETLFEQLTEALARDGHTVTVLTLWLPGTRTHENRNGVEIIRIKTPQTARRYLFTLAALPIALKRALRADIIHTTTYNAAIPAWIAALIARKPAVLTVHEVFGDQWNDLLGMHSLPAYAFRLFEWFVLHLPFARYICDSEFTRGRLLRLMNVASARATVVYPALDYSFWDVTRHAPRKVKEERGVGQDTFLYLYFGRPGISKGLEYLIDAAALIREQVPTSHLLMLLANDPLDHYQRLMQRITRLRLDDHVSVLEPVPRDDLPGYLLAADCIVIPSVSEGFGYAAAEAATLGCRVIATSGHSVQEILEGSVILVPPRDSQAIANAVVRVARESSCLEMPRRFDIASHILGVTDVYERIVSNVGLTVSSRQRGADAFFQAAISHSAVPQQEVEHEANRVM
jgi:D-inositol-3-phosphate glycosyltransferase